MKKISMEGLGRISAKEYAAQVSKPWVVVLDNIRSMHNVGSVFRTSDAFGLAHVYLCGITATPPHRDIHKSALGAEDAVPWSHAKTTADALKELKENGFHIIAIEQVEGSISLANFTTKENQKIAFVFGNEVEGVSEEALALCDEAIEIPQFGSKHSFNIAVTAGIVIWHAQVSDA